MTRKAVLALTQVRKCVELTWGCGVGQGWEDELR